MKNEIVNGTIINDISSVTTTPLTTEEIEAFKTIMGWNVASKEMIEKINVIDNSLTKLLRGFQDLRMEQKANADAISNVYKAIGIAQKDIHAITDDVSAIKSYTNPSKLNPIFDGKLSPENQALWKEKAAGLIAELCIEKNEVNKSDIYHTIYSNMKKYNGYDMSALLAEFKKYIPGASIMDMCASSEILRLSFEKEVNRLYTKKIVNNVKKKYVIKKPKCKDARLCPKEMKEIIGKMSISGVPRGRTFTNANKILVDNGIDVDKLTRDFAKKNNLSSCSKWFAIYHYPEIVKKLEELIASHSK